VSATGKQRYDESNDDEAQVATAARQTCNPSKAEAAKSCFNHLYYGHP
jgi:hypothetical protein